MGAPGVSPGPDGLGGAGLGRIGAPGTAGPPGVAAPGATTCVGTWGARGGGAPGDGGTTGRAGNSGTEVGRVRSTIPGGREGSGGGRGCRGPLGGGLGKDGPVLGCEDGAGLAGIAIVRFTGPGVVVCAPGCASGGCIAAPPPSGGRNGLKAGTARSVSAGLCSACAEGEASTAGVSVDSTAAGTSRTGARNGGLRALRSVALGGVEADAAACSAPSVSGSATAVAVLFTA